MGDPDIYKAKVVRRATRFSIRGCEYSVSEWGDADNPTLFYLHGWGDCGATFQFVVDQFDKDWHVVAPDLRGFGESRGKASAYWFPDYLADLDSLAAIYSPDEPLRLVGHSMGANIGGLYAGTFPERVCAFVNIEGFGLKDSVPDDAPVRYRQWIEALRVPSSYSDYADFSALAARLRKRNPRTSSAIAEFVARCWAEKAGDRVSMRADPLHRIPNAIIYRRAESEACWRRVEAPVLLVSGRDSTYGLSDDGTLHGDARHLPFRNAQSAVIDDAGHMMHFEAPWRLAAMIEEFLTQTL